jgi:aminoglycoside phosphotransferase family enzyme
MRTGPFESTVAFLRRPAAYPDAPGAVIAIETHMSWVFLAGLYAYKLKKPIRYNSLDLSRPELRRHNCHEEVRLNRRLASDVYLDVLAITRAPDGTLALGGPGEHVDWVIRMRRLPADRMLDAIIASGRAASEEPGIRAVARYLAHFLSAARPAPLSGPDYRARLEQGVREDVQTLSVPRYMLPRDRIESLGHAQLALLGQNPLLFDQRVHVGRIIEGHGDLRPEHICVRDEPAIIDCLEFSKDLRLLDPADELAFLALECERLGDRRVGGWFLDAYREVSGDDPPAALLHFYRVYRALRRSKIAAWHLDDPTVRDPERFAARARHYLELVEPIDPTGVSDSHS